MKRFCVSSRTLDVRTASTVRCFFCVLEWQCPVHLGLLTILPAVSLTDTEDGNVQASFSSEEIVPVLVSTCVVQLQFCTFRRDVGIAHVSDCVFTGIGVSGSVFGRSRFVMSGTFLLRLCVFSLMARSANGGVKMRNSRDDKASRSRGVW